MENKFLIKEISKQLRSNEKEISHCLQDFDDETVKKALQVSKTVNDIRDLTEFLEEANTGNKEVIAHLREFESDDDMEKCYLFAEKKLNDLKNDLQDPH